MDRANSKSLRGIKLFEGLKEAKLKRLEARCRWRRFKNGETVLDYGAAGRGDLVSVALPIANGLLMMTRR